MGHAIQRPLGVDERAQSISRRLVASGRLAASAMRLCGTLAHTLHTSPRDALYQLSYVGLTLES
jgi:hypothetical protein